MFSGDSWWHTNCIKHTIFHPRGNLKTAVWVNCWKSVTSWSSSTPCMDYWTLIRGLLMEARAVISLHSFPVTHAEIQLVFSQTVTINLDCTCWQHPAGDWLIHLMQKSTASQWKPSQLTLLKNSLSKMGSWWLEMTEQLIKEMTADDSRKEKDHLVPDKQHINMLSHAYFFFVNWLCTWFMKYQGKRILVTSWNSRFCLTSCSKSKNIQYEIISKGKSIKTSHLRSRKEI